MNTAFAGTFVVEGEAPGRGDRNRRRHPPRGHRRLTHRQTRRRRPCIVELDRVVAGDRCRSPSASGSASSLISLLVGHTGVGRLPVRHRRHRRARARGPAADGHAVAGHGRAAHGRAPRPGPPPRGRGDAGSTTFICTDKTGTLTRNEMAVVEVWTPPDRSGRTRVGVRARRRRGVAHRGRRSLRCAARCAALRRARRAERSRRRVVGRASATRWRPRSTPSPAVSAWPSTTRASSRHRRLPGSLRPAPPPDVGGRRRRPLIVKGAPDAVLPRCADAPRRGRRRCRRLAGRGLRVLAVASRAAQGVPRLQATRRERGSHRCSGLLGLEDPPRLHAADAIAACRRAGIRVAMITGDHPATARGDRRPRSACSAPTSVVLEGRDLPDDEAVLGALLDRDGVVSSAG